MSEVGQHDQPMEAEPNSGDQSQQSDSVVKRSFKSVSGAFLSKLEEKLSCHPPESYWKLWVFWNLSDHSSCSPSVNSVEIKEKIKSALQKLSIQLYFVPILIQFWAPVTIEGSRFMTTADQPFGLLEDISNVVDKGLCRYRNQSVNHNFVVDVNDGKSEEELGFPARVFRQKLPESTPNIKYYSIKQHPWRDCDSDSDDLNLVDLGLMALPVFEPSGECCGVIELVGSSLGECDMEAVCTALKAVELTCIGSCNHFEKKISNEGFQCALDEIKVVLKVISKTYDLALAQTWVPCKNCSAMAGNYFPNKQSPRVIFSKISVVYNFIDYCGDQVYETGPLRLQEDQGVVGKAYLCHNSSFCRDIKLFSLTEYPMLHYARAYDLSGCFAICLKSTYTREDYYILEFFLREKEEIYEDPRPHILDKILSTMKEHFQSFRVASGEPLAVGLHVDIVNNGRDIGNTELSDAASRYSGDKSTTEKSKILREKGITKGSKRKHEITREDLEQHFGTKLDDVAQNFGVTPYIIRRICRKNGILRWPRRNIDKVNYSLSNLDVDPSCSNMHPGQAMATVAHTRPQAMQDGMTVDIKAKDQDGNLIRFKLTSTARMKELEEEIVKRLKLKVGSFKVKYVDEDKDLILLADDGDLQNYLNSSIKSGITLIKMFIEPKTN